MFARIIPCNTCPFRITGLGGTSPIRNLGYEHAEEIVESFQAGKTFTCHSDIEKSESDRQHCVGVMLILEKLNCPNQMMRIMERIGCYDRDQLKGHDEVFDDFADWIDAQSE